jgi:hypothetical protein
VLLILFGLFKLAEHLNSDHPTGGATS